MLYFILGFIVGILTGWWFVPQPRWAADLYERLRAWFNE